MSMRQLPEGKIVWLSETRDWGGPASLGSLAAYSRWSACRRSPRPRSSGNGFHFVTPVIRSMDSGLRRLQPGREDTDGCDGSGAGIAAAISGTAEIGASDAYMSDEQAEQNPQIVNIPLAIAAQTINYNLPELGATPLKLDGPTIGGHLHRGRSANGMQRRSRLSIPGLRCRITRLSRSAARTHRAILSSLASFSIFPRRVGTTRLATGLEDHVAGSPG